MRCWPLWQCIFPLIKIKGIREKVPTAPENVSLTQDQTLTSCNPTTPLNTAANLNPGLKINTEVSSKVNEHETHKGLEVSVDGLRKTMLDSSTHIRIMEALDPLEQHMGFQFDMLLHKSWQCCYTYFYIELIIIFFNRCFPLKCLSALQKWIFCCFVRFIKHVILILFAQGLTNEKWESSLNLALMSVYSQG